VRSNTGPGMRAQGINTDPAGIRRAAPGGKTAGRAPAQHLRAPAQHPPGSMETKRAGQLARPSRNPPPSGGFQDAATKAHAASGSADGAPVEPEHQRATAAPNTVQRIGPCSATPQTGRGLPGEWRQRRRDRRVHVGRSCGGQPRDQTK
jgi:hypothetical protein